MSSKNIYKILLLGDEKVGKTSLYNKYVTGEFPNEYHESKVVQNKKFELNLSLEEEPINIQLYDTPGNEDKHKLYTSIYLKIDCIIVLFDLTNKKSFENAFNKWIPNFFNSKKVKNPQNISVVVLGNFRDISPKIEVKEEEISKSMKEIQKYTEKYKYKEISVQEDDVVSLFGLIGNFIKKRESKESKNDKDGIDKFLIFKAKHRYNCKVLFLGDAKVGKTSILNRYINENFSEEYKQTLSDENKSKELFLSSEKINELYTDKEKEEEINEMPKEFYDDSMIQMDLWDTPGQEDVHNFNRNYYKHATCCVLVFDLCDRISFEQVLNWRNNFLQYLKIISIPNEYETKYYDIIDEIPFILVGNKNDLKREITEEEIEEFMEENKKEIKCYNEISAKDNKGIKEVFDNVCKYSYIFKVKEMFDTLKKISKEDKEDTDIKEEKQNEEKDKNEEKERLEKEERERLEKEEREREIKERERLLKEKEEKERLEQEEKERKEKEKLEQEEKIRKEKEENERKEKLKQEEIEKKKEEELEKAETKIENPQNISLIFELEKYFINKEGNPTQFLLEENKEKIFIQIINSLFKKYPCLNLIGIKSFENKENNNKIDYYSNVIENNLNDKSIIVIKLE